MRYFCTLLLIIAFLIYADLAYADWRNEAKEKYQNYKTIEELEYERWVKLEKQQNPQVKIIEETNDGYRETLLHVYSVLRDGYNIVLNSGCQELSEFSFNEIKAELKKQVVYDLLRPNLPSHGGGYSMSGQMGPLTVGHSRSTTYPSVSFLSPVYVSAELCRKISELYGLKDFSCLTCSGNFSYLGVKYIVQNTNVIFASSYLNGIEYEYTPATLVFKNGGHSISFAFHITSDTYSDRLVEKTVIEVTNVNMPAEIKRTLQFLSKKGDKAYSFDLKVLDVIDKLYQKLSVELGMSAQIFASIVLLKPTYFQELLAKFLETEINK